MNSEISYQFIPLPFKVACCCDSVCLAVLSVLIQKHNYWKDKRRLDDKGYFYVLNSEIEARIKHKRNVVNEAIEGLYRRSIIDVIATSRRQECNKYKVNWDVIISYDKIPVSELCHPDLLICKARREEKLTYVERGLQADCTTTLETINNIDIINKNNINDSSNCTVTESSTFFEQVNEEIENDIMVIFKAIVLGGCYEHRIFFTDSEHDELKDLLKGLKTFSLNDTYTFPNLKYWAANLTKSEVIASVKNVISKLEKEFMSCF